MDEYEQTLLAMHHMLETITRQHEELARLRPIVAQLQLSRRILTRGGAGRVVPGCSR